MQFGPIRRMPNARARSRIAACMAAPSGRPVSANPAVKKWIDRTPLAPACSNKSGTTEAAAATITWSTGPGISPSEA